MRVIATALTASLGIVAAAPHVAGAQSIILTAGLGPACRGSDGSICDRDTSAVTATAGLRASDRFVIAFRASRFDTASTGDVSYYGGQVPVEIARLRHEFGRMMKYGVELLYHPSARAGKAVSAFVGGGTGMRRLRHRTTCVFGECEQPGPYAELLRDERVGLRYVSFVAGVDVGIAYGLSVRGTLRLDDFPSEMGAAHIALELGYLFPTR